MLSFFEKTQLYPILRKNGYGKNRNRPKKSFGLNIVGNKAVPG